MQDPKSTYFRYRVFYSKSAAARFVGHLDLQGLFSKALKRATLPVAYSQGFNPHQLLSIAMPLSMGLSGRRELFEVFLTNELDVENIAQRLAAQMPAGLEILEAQLASNSGKAAAGLLYGAKYIITFPAEVSATKPAEIAEDIFEISQIDANSLEVTLAAGSKKNLKPQKFAQLLIAQLGLDFDEKLIKYERTELLL